MTAKKKECLLDYQGQFGKIPMNLFRVGLNAQEIAIYTFLACLPASFDPTEEKIAGATGLGLTTVSKYVRSLCEKGLIEHKGKGQLGRNRYAFVDCSEWKVAVVFDPYNRAIGPSPDDSPLQADPRATGVGPVPHEGQDPRQTLNKHRVENRDEHGVAQNEAIHSSQKDTSSLKEEKIKSEGDSPASAAAEPAPHAAEFEVLETAIAAALDGRQYYQRVKEEILKFTTHVENIPTDEQFGTILIRQLSMKFQKRETDVFQSKHFEGVLRLAMDAFSESKKLRANQQSKPLHATLLERWNEQVVTEGTECEIALNTVIGCAMASAIGGAEDFECLCPARRYMRSASAKAGLERIAVSEYQKMVQSAKSWFSRELDINAGTFDPIICRMKLELICGHLESLYPKA